MMKFYLSALLSMAVSVVHALYLFPFGSEQ